MFLKHATPQNIVIGGAAGAAPPVLGWTAMTGICPGGVLTTSLAAKIKRAAAPREGAC